MTFIARSRFAVVGFALLFALSASAQDAAPPAAGAAAPPARARGPMPPPKNIKALSKDITSEQLMKLMHQYEADLGVNCGFCHAQDPETKRMNFASDANPMKDTARYMITMTADLNDKYLAEMPGRMYADPITCGTCHQGHSHPAPFVPTPHEHEGAPPAAAATH